ncbi:hypothetical protein, conserved [Leishmania tarentolae]|uniref:EF-hand domain-containing protein n=1 Tax=Leishmania tarentolae TaxID=5689 RepID=A0A640KDV8_LEITA|nr:hypothetical protein, conserved [Leishmania tarentolae]
MRQDGQMNSQLECSCDGVNEKPLTRVSPRVHWSQSGEEGQARQSGSNSHVGSSSSTTVNSVSTSNDCSRESAFGKHRISASGSQSTVFAPPSTPSPHHGFRRNTANIMAAGRRVSHRSASVLSVSAGDQGIIQPPSSGNVEAAFSSSHRTRHRGGATANGSATREDNCSILYEDLNNSSRIVRRRANEVASGTGTNTTAPGTLPDSYGQFNQYTGASGAVSGPSAAGDRYVTLRGHNGDHFFQIDSAEAATALIVEKNRPATESDRRTRNRYPMLWRASSSPPVPATANESSSSCHQHQQLSPRLHLYSSPPAPSSAEEIARNASLVLSTHRGEKGNDEEAKGCRHYSRHTGVTTSQGVESIPQNVAASAPATLSAWFSGFTTAQQQRFENLQGRGPPGHEMARWKMLELMRHWMSMPSTRAGLDAVIRDVLVDAGIAKAKEAWGGGDASTVASCDSASSVQLQQPGGSSEPSTKASLKKVSPKNKLIATSVALEWDCDHSSTTASGKEEKRQQECTKEVPRPVPDEALVPSLDQVTPGSTPTPHTVAIALSSPALVERGTTLPPDEATPSVTAAKVRSTSARRRRRKSSKGTASAQGEQAPPMDGPHSPTSQEVKGNTDESAALLVGLLTPEKHAGHLTLKSDVSFGTTASCERTDAVNDARVSPQRYTESPCLHHSPSEEALPNSPHNSPPSPHQRSCSNNPKAAPSRQEATYEEIPPFYFPLGHPTTGEIMISGPLSSKHENPHLKIVDGVSVSALMYDGGESSRMGANTGALVGTSKDSVLFPESRRAQKVAPMSQLHALDDRQVAHYIQREFGRLPPLPRHSQRVWLLGGRLRSGSHKHSNLPFAKQEVLYRQQFIQCVQRLCSQCFGVPRYFAFLILRFIQWEVHKGNPDAAESRSPPQTRDGNGHMGSSSSLMSYTANGGGSGATGLPSIFLITAQHMKNFYETYLKNKDIVRRIFDLLILSSYLPTSPAAAASLAVMGKATETNAEASSTPVPSLSASPLRSFLLPKDFVAYISVLLSYHPGLAFLRQTPDFQTKYLDTVIYRIFYELDRFDRGCISYSELAASRLIDAFRQVDSAEDINMVLLFFSYEHFYVLYCRFWELDEDRDMLLAPEDLMRYAPEDVMNPCIVQRVFAGAGRRRSCTVPHRIGYEDFVWFCLSEEDKSTPQAIRYWFRVLDLDGDGVLSVYELRQFYNATRDRIAQYVQEGLATFEDVVCQVFDMMRCSEYRGLFLSDLMREPEATAVALNLLTNVVKFLQFEQHDPFVAHEERLLGGPEQSTWDRFARLEYDRMTLEADEGD